MKPCMSYMCRYKITNIYRVGALTAIETDKLGGETVWELWEVLFAPLQTFVMLYNVIVMLYTVIVMLFYVIKIVMLYNNITQQLPITKNEALYFYHWIILFNVHLYNILRKKITITFIVF